MSDVGALRCVDLGPGPAPENLVRAMAGAPGLVCLRGDWADGDALLTSHPLEVRTDLDLGVVPDEPGDAVGGGWFGYMPYTGVPRFAFHDHVVRLVDGQWRFEMLWTPDRDAELDARLDAWRDAVTGDPIADLAWHVGDVAVPPAHDHLAAVERAVELIRAGELYQVNVCTRLRAAFTGSPVAMFADLAGSLRPVRGALLTGGDVTVVSMSPELFLDVHGRSVRTAPIKGTLPRDGTPATAGNDARLRASAKDAAENVMIVDLMRNDLGRVSETGSVRVERLLEVEPHPGVWHLVSAVTGRLAPGAAWADVLTATLPPGSVTGAPKIRATQAIEELEATPRGVYTGAIGFVSPIRGAQFNVAIRTFEVVDGRVELGVGGGITADSVPMLEWRECLHKAAPLLRAARVAAVVEPEPPRPVAGTDVFETVLAVDGEPLRLADHLARLDRSARELHGAYGAGDLGVLARRARDAVRGTSGRVALRIVLAGAEVTVSAAPARARPTSSAARTIRRPAALWRHKWTDRLAYGSDEADVAPDVPLYVADDGSVLETSRGSVFLLRPDGGLVTPPLRDDLLPGVTRRAVLDLARDEGRPTELRTFDVEELCAHPAFWTSSLSGAVPIHSADGRPLPRAGELVAAIAAGLLGGGRDDR